MVKSRREEWFDIIGDEPCTGVKERLSPIQDDYNVTVDYLLECILTTVGSFTTDPSNVTGQSRKDTVLEMVPIYTSGKVKQTCLGTHHEPSVSSAW